MFLAGVFAAAGVSELKPGDSHLAQKVLHFFFTSHSGSKCTR